MAGDHQVIGTYHASAPLKIGTDVAVMSGGFLIEGQNLKPGCQPLYLKAAFCWLVGLGGAMPNAA